MNKLREILVISLLHGVLRSARWFWRMQYLNQPDETQATRIYAHWHGDELMLLPVFAHQRYAVMSSRSRDGERMSRLLNRLGYFVVRGSSSKGGAGGLKGLIDAVNDRKLNAAIAVDGPRGPVFQVKPGILALAQATGLPIYPASGAANRFWTIPGAWNQTYIPKPFAKCVLVFGEPLVVPKGATESELEELRLDLECRLKEARSRAERLVLQRSRRDDDKSRARLLPLEG